MKKKESFLEKEKRYWVYREAARQALSIDLQNTYSFPVTLSDINPLAISQALSWQWNWDEKLTGFRKRY